MAVGEKSQRPRRGLGARIAKSLGRGSGKPAEPEHPDPPLADPQAGEPALPPDAEWVNAAMDEFENRLAEALKEAGEELYAQVERDLAAAEERLRETERRLETTVSDRLEGVVAELRVQGDAQLADELKRVKEAAELPLTSIRKAEADAVGAAEAAAARAEQSAVKSAAQIDATAEKLGARARRQELKLAREETSKRMTGALARLEHQAEQRMNEVEAVRAESEKLLTQVDERVGAADAAATELERRLDAVGQRLAETETRSNTAGALIENAVTRLEEVVRRFDEAERHVLEVERRVSTAARRIADLGAHAERAIDWEDRFAAATRAEADAAQRISEAERRLLDRIDPDAGAS